MLVIFFYDYRQKYIYQTMPFQNGDVRAMLHQAAAVLESSPEIEGYTVYECVDNELFPYCPFNRSYRYERGKSIRA